MHFLTGAIIAAVVAGVLLLAIGCGDPARAPAVCATRQAPNGQWIEEDNEAVDGDPCDTDDQFEDQGGYDFRKKKPVPAKTSAPIGGKKKRF